MPKAIKRSDEEKEKERRWRSLSIEDHPPTCPTGDGENTLHRFEVKGVVYAFDKQDAESRCSEWDLGTVLDAAVVEESE